MSFERNGRPRGPDGRLRRWASRLSGALGPSERSILTREGFLYFMVSLALLFAGLVQQINLVLLVFTLAAGPFLASVFGGRAMLRRLALQRRVPPYIFAADPLVLEYAVENLRRWQPALTLFIEDALVPVDRAVSGPTTVAPLVFFPHVPAGDRARGTWSATGARRGRYRFRDLDVGTRAPFGIVEYRVTVPMPDELLVYPRVGRLTRRWHLMQRQASENRRGPRHDRSAQQIEYHGLRDYRSGDSPRWIHWRTSARRGELMVKEFEHQNEQDLAVLIDPWLPDARATAEQREAVERAISFAATVCLETCRRSGRRLLLGWTGPAPGARHGPASVKLLHELLEQLAVLRPSSEGRLSDVLDVLPSGTLREAVLIAVTTRPLNLLEEAERSARLAGAAARNLVGRAILLNAAQGDLASLFEMEGASSRDILNQRSGDGEAAPADRPLGTAARHRAALRDGGGPDASRDGDGDGDAPFLAAGDDDENRRNNATTGARAAKDDARARRPNRPPSGLRGNGAP